MADWREAILKYFQEPVHRLTLVADPDSLLLEEQLLAAIRRNGFDLIPYEDPIAFRYAYESGYRQRWDEGMDTDLVVILHAPGASLRFLPYDLLHSGRTLAFSLPELFPGLSYPVIRELDRTYLQPLYLAYEKRSGPELGDRATALFVLKHVFGITPDLVKSPAALLKLLLSYHGRGERLPPRLGALLLESLRQNLAFEHWPLESLLNSASEFWAFLQQRWGTYLASRQPAAVAFKEGGPGYEAGEVLPFDDPDVRAYVDTFFVEGKLKAIPLPEGWSVDGWAQIGVQIDESASELRRFSRLWSALSDHFPAGTATHRDWLSYAALWAELTVLFHHLGSNLDPESITAFQSLHLRLEERFTQWMLSRYHALHSLPSLPSPVMVDRVPHLMAATLRQRPESRLALLVVDGLALDQWRVIQEVWNAEGCSWAITEGQLFAWVPTLTPISRQSMLAGKGPRFFPNSWQTSDQEAAYWQRFWLDQGLLQNQIGYQRNLGVRQLSSEGSVLPDRQDQLEIEVEGIIGKPNLKVLGLVVNTVDHIIHGMQLGTAGMHGQVQLWMTRYRYLTTLVGRLLEEGFDIYLTSDHGNIAARGIGQLKEGSLVETRGQRARTYTDPAFLAQAKEGVPTAIEWTNAGLPATLSVLLASHLDAFIEAGQQAICHGGIAIEEVIVPFVKITAELTE